MNLARQVNEGLDDLIRIRNEIADLIKEVPPSGTLNNIEEGTTVTREDAIDVAEELMGRIKDNLIQITNSGQNCRDLFTNQYYINDLNQK
tara:strand:+ start:9701 stop:9970 length:270 start_codon:yes stop_codon:yes gene_type:complete